MKKALVQTKAVEVRKTVVEKKAASTNKTVEPLNEKIPPRPRNAKTVKKG